jgi:hypothetical protein
MGRTKGSKNGVKKKEPTQDILERCSVKERPVSPSKLPFDKAVKVLKEQSLRVEGVSPRKESPPIPQVLVDGGMLYRFLLELRRHYDELVSNEQNKKGVMKVIDEISDYIIRMEKK